MGQTFSKRKLRAHINFYQSAKVIYNCLACNVLKENLTEKDSLEDSLFNCYPVC